MSKVTKSEGWEVYSVRAGDQGFSEWATIAIKQWEAKTNDGSPRHVGEIMIHSSYGSWAFQWGYLGEPFKQWLATAKDRSYIAGKFMGDKAYKFDGEKTVQGLRRDLIELRRCDGMTKEDARAIWDFIYEHECEMEANADLFVERMLNCSSQADWPPRNGRYSDAGPGDGARYFLQDPWERIATSLDSSFSSFWETIMPAFQQALLQELQQSKEAA